MHDSNTESNDGTPWARPTPLLHIVPGGEYGWRSGWSNWPEYWADSLAVGDAHGSRVTTGCMFYEHTTYPAKYRHALFSCDWAEGRIVAYHLQPRGASFTAEAEVFLEGRPLNVTDMDIGPDGWLYFCTGGRGTQGNLYRVVVESAVAPTPRTGPGVLPAVRQPQPHSAWGRQAISTKRHRMGGQWDFELRAFVSDRSQDACGSCAGTRLDAPRRTSPDRLGVGRVGGDPDPRVRRQAAYLMGLIGNQPVRESLENTAVGSGSAFVRRQACESIVRGGGQVAFAKLAPC